MLRKLPELAVRRPVAVGMFLVALLVAGAIAAMRLPVAYLPDIDVPRVTVRVVHRDSHPQEVERTIVKPLEDALATLPGIKAMNSFADPNGARIELEFFWGDNLDVVRMLVREKVDEVAPELPDAAQEPMIFSFGTNDIPVVQARISARGADLSRSYGLLQKHVVTVVRQIPGVARVELDGVTQPEVDIDLDLGKVNAHRIDLSALIGALNAASTMAVLGEIDQGGLRQRVRVVGRFDAIEDLETFPIAGTNLVVGDIAKVHKTRRPVSFYRRVNGHGAVGLSVYKESTANTVEVAPSGSTCLEASIGGGQSAVRY